MAQDLTDRVAELPRRSQAAFFVVVGAALRPLYDDFHRKTRWGDPGVLDRGLDAARSFALNGRAVETERLLAELTEVAPHGDDFDAPASTFAQDAVICVDAAVRCAGGEPSPAAVEFTLEPTLTALCLRDLGATSHSSSQEDEAWRRAVESDSAWLEAVRVCEDTIRAVDDPAAISAELLDRLTAEARVLLPQRSEG